LANRRNNNDNNNNATLSKAEASVLKFILTFDVITVCEDTFKLMTRLGDEGTMKADWLQFLES